MPKIALLQMTSGIDPEANAATICEAAEKAAAESAKILFTPEMAGLLDRKRERAADNIASEETSLVARRVAACAAEYGIWISLGLPVELAGGRWANRTLLINSEGDVAARYDKIHMFDVDLSTGESWRESNAYEAGGKVVTAQDTPVGRLGLTTCYDIRFPALFEELGRQRCDSIAIPAAFTVPTGKSHWHLMQRARAVEASAFVIAAAQVGKHEDGRETFGHSLVVDPWGEVLLDMSGDKPGLGYCTIDLARIEDVRRQLPSLANRREIPKSRNQ